LHITLAKTGSGEQAEKQQGAENEHGARGAARSE